MQYLIKNSLTLHQVFFENHDMPRIAATNSDASIAQNAAAFTILGDGIPIIFYGQEHNLNGGNDPYNRVAAWLPQNGELSTNNPLVDYVTTLNKIRAWAIKKSPGYTTYGTYVLNYSEDQISIRKDVLRTILTNAGMSQPSASYITQGSAFEAGATVVDMISCKAYQADDDGEVTVTIGAGAVVVLLEQDLAQGSGVCDDLLKVGSTTRWTNF